METMKKCTIFWLEKPERKGPLKRHRHRWEVNIIMDLREIGWVDMEWMRLAKDRDQWQAVVNVVMNLRVP
jgi:hypothetical protein